MMLDELVRAAGRRRGDPRRRLGRDLRRSPTTAAAWTPGTLFFCVRGERSDGHEFAAAGGRGGARRRWWSSAPLDLGVPEVLVADARAAMAPLAAAFHGDPTAELTVVGITGTNGKTTTAFLVRELLEAAGRRCGLLGTVKRVVGGEVEEVERTTPEAIDLQATFRRMLEAGDGACAMEVSSHALALHRADAIHFDVKVFTNLTQDHLDFHADMEDYFAAKRLLFPPRAAPRAGARGRRLGGQRRRPLRPAAGRGARAGAGGGCVTFSAAGGRRPTCSARGVELRRRRVDASCA